MSQIHTEQEVQANDPEQSPPGAWLHSLTSQTPWWVVSTVFHGLLIVFIGLMTLAVDTPDESNLIPIVNPYIPPHREEATVPERTDHAHGLSLAPTNYDPKKPISDILIPPEIQQYYRESVRFEDTDPFARPEDHGTNAGNIDAKIFMPSKFATENVGGGGRGGSSIIEDMLGAGSVSMAGDGGGRFGGKGAGDGPGKGSGRGSYAMRMSVGGHLRSFIPYNRPGGPTAREWDDSLKRSLRWLAYHQEPDGHWDVKKYGAQHKNDTAITGLALLAFVGYGNTEKLGDHRDNVKLAVKWLIAHQGPDGLISDPTDDTATHRHGGYPMAIATLALVEAAGMSNVPETRAAAQKAIDCVMNLQSGDGSDRMGWRYAAKSEGDLSVTGWFIMALKSAKVSRLHVDVGAIDGAIHFLESVEVKDAGPDKGYGPPSRFKYMKNNEHAESGHRLTAIGTLARQFLGWKRDETQGSVDYFIQKGGLPSWGAAGEKVDLYYWYYGSMASFQQGKETFAPWSAALLDALLPNQRKDGDDNGSWDAVGEYSGEWGRVGQTALSTLSLEVYFRWPLANEK